MTKPKWTPGPWHVSKDGESVLCGNPVDPLIVCHTTGIDIAHVGNKPDGSEEYQTRANAHLIAAAPGLYAALIIAREWLLAAEYAGKIGGEELKRDLEAINNALAQARGEG